mgnify:CR=1 FL=1
MFPNLFNISVCIGCAFSNRIGNERRILSFFRVSCSQMLDRTVEARYNSYRTNRNFGEIMQVYADNAATAKMRPAAIQTYISTAKEYYGNPSSLHEAGQAAKELLEESRAHIANMIRAEAKQTIKPYSARRCSARKKERKKSYPPQSNTMPYFMRSIG